MSDAAFFPQDIIARKRDGHALSRRQVDAFVRGVVTGEFRDYQSSALLMAIVLNGMSEEETVWLTEAMMRSGEILSFPGVDGPKIDKHSTGGVGDKVSLILAPWAAACGLKVPMMSGRGLGHTGGTLDKLESIPGFRVNLGADAVEKQLQTVGFAMVGQTPQLVPADRKLYALRDVTATVESIPLICASIMSKKLAEGIDGLVLDVKFGHGAFMKDKARAVELAKAMVRIGESTGKCTRAVMTNMNQPLGRSVGNSVEVIESLECLKGRGPADLMEVTAALLQEMLELGGLAKNPADARKIMDEQLKSGAALNRFRLCIEAQGGDPGVVDDYGRLPSAESSREMRAERDGYVVSVDAKSVGMAALALGAGRASMDAHIDPAAGIDRLVKIGERVLGGQTIARLAGAASSRIDEAERLLRAGIRIGGEGVSPEPLIGETIG